VAREGLLTSPCVAANSANRRREPDRPLLHQTVRAHLKTFLAETEQRGDGAGLPSFVIAEFERYLACVILANGFARVRCSPFGDELLVAFSCDLLFAARPPETNDRLYFRARRCVVRCCRAL
jgi:hypothetical protein